MDMMQARGLCVAGAKFANGNAETFEDEE